MSEIIDILTQAGDASFKFTVDTAVNYVDVVKTNDGEMSVCKTSGATKYFQWKDNPILLSMGCILPLGFEFWENADAIPDQFPPTVNIQFRGNPSGAIFFPTPRIYCLPWPNYEISLGQFHDLPTINEEFAIEMELSSSPAQRISMLNVPAALDEMTFYCPLFLKVMHTKDIMN